ncbi:MAG: YSC84-related protein [Endozoicomonas sp. (ex Botrylloides leachii)]|nr:YSC84-related protein [Endozoicomonas sp. (ex Botrylloides leachii)]
MFRRLSYLVLLIVILLPGCASMGSGTVAEKRQSILAMKTQVLNQLYKQKPYVKEQIKSSPGYAVFSNANINLIVVSAGTGYGVVTSASGKNTYMNMAEGGVGLGVGAKDYRIVMVFHTQKAMDNFIKNGWTFGGNADAAAKITDKGASVQGEAYYGDVTVYTFTESGLALQATVKGTKFWPDTELN